MPDSSDPHAPERYTLAEVLRLVPKTKRSQVELLVRTKRIIPAWPSAGTGHDRAFDARNVFEIALAAELIAIGIVGAQFTETYPHIRRLVHSDTAPPDAPCLVLFWAEDGTLMVCPALLPLRQLLDYLEIQPSARVVNVRLVLERVRRALSDL
jgi:hypothetical protein